MKKYKVLVTKNNINKTVNHLADLLVKSVDQTDVVVELSRPKRSLDQNAKIHAMIADIRGQAVETLGAIVDGQTKIYTLPLSKLSFDAVKGFLVSRFVAECERSGVVTKAKCRWIFDPVFSKWVEVRPSTTDFDKQTGAQLIEFLYSYAADKNVKLAEDM